MNQPQLLAVLLPLFLLSGLGLLMMRAHHRTWRSQMTGPSSDSDEYEQKHLARRYRRRMQASGLLTFLGVLIAAGQYIDGKAFPKLFTVYWLGVILLTFWLILLALGDALAIANYSRIAQARLEGHRKELETELERLRAREGNGHSQTFDAPSDRESTDDSV